MSSLPLVKASIKRNLTSEAMPFCCQSLTIRFASSNGSEVVEQWSDYQTRSVELPYSHEAAAIPWLQTPPASRHCFDLIYLMLTS
jgi:hypothetical protein